MKTAKPGLPKSNKRLMLAIVVGIRRALGKKTPADRVADGRKK